MTDISKEAIQKTMAKLFAAAPERTVLPIVKVVRDGDWNMCYDENGGLVMGVGDNTAAMLKKTFDLDIFDPSIEQVKS